MADYLDRKGWWYEIK
ncbi:TPA: hypothetical protein QCN90_004962 [Bacillus pacificus]|uniref:Uncharacterized protein n=1 Tax=Bacillus pacificus TaxID=2026187 RepID=A0ABX6IBI7_9BACI|nr:hypothetical protein [Bacillus cereus]MDR4258037.1 hypothetical protein [Bacillus pacificus]MBL3858219.1 hypothetical protein [Bacillus cereus]QHH92197.1 hypothetical protein FPL01_04480 [Bacillus pacificus]RRB03330.1 hypothetical protein EH195_12705 [Bacillus pacificus]